MVSCWPESVYTSSLARSMGQSSGGKPNGAVRSVGGPSPTRGAPAVSDNLPPKELEELVEQVFQKGTDGQNDASAQEWYASLQPGERITLDQGVEAILRAGLALAAKRSFNTVLRQRMENQRQASARIRPQQHLCANGHSDSRLNTIKLSPERRRRLSQDEGPHRSKSATEQRGHYVHGQPDYRGSNYDSHYRGMQTRQYSGGYEDSYYTGAYKDERSSRYDDHRERSRSNRDDMSHSKSYRRRSRSHSSRRDRDRRMNDDYLRNPRPDLGYNRSPSRTAQRTHRARRRSASREESRSSLTLDVGRDRSRSHGRGSRRSNGGEGTYEADRYQRKAQLDVAAAEETSQAGASLSRQTSRKASRTSDRKRHYRSRRSHSRSNSEEDERHHRRRRNHRHQSSSTSASRGSSLSSHRRSRRHSPDRHKSRKRHHRSPSPNDRDSQSDRRRRSSRHSSRKKHRREKEKKREGEKRQFSIGAKEGQMPPPASP